MEEDAGQAGGVHRERLTFIDFRLYFLGVVSRSAIDKGFGVASVAVMRRPASCCFIANETDRLDAQIEACLAIEEARPLFTHLSERAPPAFPVALRDGSGVACDGLRSCGYAVRINRRPSLKFLVAVSRAIRCGVALIEVDSAIIACGCDSRETGRG